MGMLSTSLPQNRMKCLVSMVNQGKYEEAESLFRLAVSLAEANLGTQHPEFPVRLTNCAGILSSQITTNTYPKDVRHASVGS